MPCSQILQHPREVLRREVGDESQQILPKVDSFVRDRPAEAHREERGVHGRGHLQTRPQLTKHALFANFTTPPRGIKEEVGDESQQILPKNDSLVRDRQAEAHREERRVRSRGDLQRA